MKFFEILGGRGSAKNLGIEGENSIVVCGNLVKFFGINCTSNKNRSHAELVEA